MNKRLKLNFLAAGTQIIVKISDRSNYRNNAIDNYSHLGILALQ